MQSYGGDITRGAGDITLAPADIPLRDGGDIMVISRCRPW